MLIVLFLKLVAQDSTTPGVFITPSEASRGSWKTSVHQVFYAFAYNASNSADKKIIYLKMIEVTKLFLTAISALAEDRKKVLQDELSRETGS